MLQFNLMVLIFAVITLVRLRRSLDSTLLDVFLPVLLVMPEIYFLRVPHLPLVSCYDVVLLPLGIATIVSRRRYWRFQRADLWVIAYAFSGFYTDYINLDLKTAIYNFAEPGFLGGIFAYIIGKLLIEQMGLRERFARRVVVLLAAVGFISLTEFFAKRNLLVVATHRFFGHVDYWSDQYRSGFLRVKGPFMGPEEAGIVFLMGLLLALWIWRLDKSRNDQIQQKFLGLPLSAVCIAGILLGLIMTLSRGPAIGAGVACLIAWIGLAKRKHLAIVIAVIVLAAGGVAAYQKVAASPLADSAMASGDPGNMDESQASESYRTRLYDVYKPVAEAGGLFGWSGTLYPKAARELNPEAADYFSIDNEYLLLWVAQGKVGLTLFLLILLETGLALFRSIMHSNQPIDTSFYYCLAGMLAGLVVVIGTVFLAGQGYILFFLVCGWAQSLPDNAWEAQAASSFAFRRVFT